MELLLSIIIGTLVNALIIYVVGKLGLGMSVAGFVPAIVAALVISVITALVLWLMNMAGISFGGGWIGAIVSLVVSAIVLMLAANLLPGFTVDGFTGALVAALAIAVVAWLIGLVLPQTMVLTPTAMRLLNLG
jgi:putative membrane protein